MYFVHQHDHLRVKYIENVWEKEKKIFVQGWKL